MGAPTIERPFAVITGASSGIGHELAKQFAEHGYDVVIAAEDAGIDRVVNVDAANARRCLRPRADG